MDPSSNAKFTHELPEVQRPVFHGPFSVKIHVELILQEMRNVCGKVVPTPFTKDLDSLYRLLIITQ
jgi:hypothetical protein